MEHNPEQKPQPQKPATATMISKSIKPNTASIPMGPVQPTQTEARQQEVTSMDYKHTAIWQESMRRLGRKAARDILGRAKDGSTVSPEATAAQRAAYEQGRKDARVIPSCQK